MIRGGKELVKVEMARHIGLSSEIRAYMLLVSAVAAMFVSLFGRIALGRAVLLPYVDGFGSYLGSMVMVMGPAYLASLAVGALPGAVRSDSSLALAYGGFWAVLLAATLAILGWRADPAAHLAIQTEPARVIAEMALAPMLALIAMLLRKQRLLTGDAASLARLGSEMVNAAGAAMLTIWMIVFLGITVA